jgi:hypothetical protein
VDRRVVAGRRRRANRVDLATWAIARDGSNNNLNGLAWDPTGAFDATGTPAMYFVDQSFLYRRDGSGTATSLVAQNDTMDWLVVSATVIFVENNLTTDEIDTVGSGTHALATLATSSAFHVVEEGPLSATSVIAIANTSYAGSAASPIASSTDPNWVWPSASAPQPPHPLAGGYVVLESNRVLDRDELVYIAPGQ